MKTLLMLSFLVYTSAYICCPPKQYEGSITEYGGFYAPQSKTAGLLTISANIHYDYTNQKMLFNETVTVLGKDTVVAVLQDYTQKVQYFIMNGVCTKMALPGTVDDNCIPDDAIFIGTFDYGMGKLKASTYRYNQTQFGTEMDLYTVVTTEDCVSVLFHAVSQDAQSTSVVSGTFCNITPGIKDPKVFDVPASCLHRTVDFPLTVELDNEVTGTSVMKALMKQFR
ncbi:ependymin-related protein 1-like [Glandiceps talaboti]